MQLMIIPFLNFQKNNNYFKHESDFSIPFMRLDIFYVYRKYFHYDVLKLNVTLYFFLKQIHIQTTSILVALPQTIA